MAKRGPALAVWSALALLALPPGCKKQPRGAPREPPSAPPAPASPSPSATPGEISGPVGIASGPFVGFGMRLRGTSRAVAIEHVFVDTPASAADLRKGDLIVAIDGESTLGWSVPQVMSRLRGAEGTEAGLDLERGIDPIQVRMVRRRLPSVPLPGTGP